jgi:hypothetical protein
MDKETTTLKVVTVSELRAIGYQKMSQWYFKRGDLLKCATSIAQEMNHAHLMTTPQRYFIKFWNEDEILQKVCDFINAKIAAEELQD